MRLFIALLFVFYTVVLGNELSTGEALSKSGSLNVNEKPNLYYFKITFHGAIWLTLLICLFLPQKKLDSFNEWLKQFDSNYHDKN